MKQTAMRITRFLMAPVPVQTLGLYRILVSAFALVQLLVLLPDWMWFYGPDAIIPWQIGDALSTTNTPALSHMQALLEPLGFTALTTTYLITSLYFFSLAGLLIGYKTRLMGVLSWLTHIIVNTSGHFTAYGVETFTHISLFYCMVLPVGACWSLDARRKAIVIPAYLITLAVRVVQLHLCIMYLSSGIEKALGAQWWNGEAIWIAMQQDQFRQINTGWMAQVPWLPVILCWSTLVLEVLFPVGMFFSATKKLWLAGIVGMHLFIAVFLGLQLFGALMIILDLAAFGEHCFPGLFSKKWRARKASVPRLRVALLSWFVLNHGDTKGTKRHKGISL